MVNPTGESSGEARPIFHSSDAPTRDHVFCSFLALAMQKHLGDLLRHAGLAFKWKDLPRDLDRLARKARPPPPPGQSKLARKRRGRPSLCHADLKFARTPRQSKHCENQVFKSGQSTFGHLRSHLTLTVPDILGWFWQP